MGISSVLAQRLYRQHQILEFMARGEHARSIEGVVRAHDSSEVSVKASPRREQRA